MKHQIILKLYGSAVSLEKARCELESLDAIEHADVSANCSEFALTLSRPLFHMDMVEILCYTGIEALQIKSIPDKQERLSGKCFMRFP